MTSKLKLLLTSTSIASLFPLALTNCRPRSPENSSSLASHNSSSQLHMNYVEQCGKPSISKFQIGANKLRSISGDSTSKTSSTSAQVTKLFNETCSDCHGNGQTPAFLKNSQIEMSEFERYTKFNRQQGESAQSTGLYKALSRSASFMPQGGTRFSSAQLKLVEKWIDEQNVEKANATRTVDFISDIDRVWCVSKDLSELTDNQRPFARYLSFSHLYNSKESPEQINQVQISISKLLNSLSWGREIVKPAIIDPSGTILRIDIRDYDWTNHDWNMAASLSPYRTEMNDSKLQQINSYIGTNSFEIRGDWFVFAASKPPLYYDLLKTPKTDRELEQQLGVNVDQNIRNGIAIRSGFRGSDAGITGSGVSRNNRLIERHPSRYGVYWKSYDFNGNTGQKSFFEYPLGPMSAFPGAKTFLQDGGEMIYSLPNGLHGYMLINDKGNRINEGPIDVVFDRSNQNDPRIVNGASCMKCHTGGMIEKSDRVRVELEQSSALDIETRRYVEMLYNPQDRQRSLSTWFQRDQSQYQASLEATGAEIGKPDPVYLTSVGFLRHVDVNQVSAEFGLTREEFEMSLRRFPGGVPTSWSSLLVPEGRIPRELITRDFSMIFRGLGRRGYIVFGPEQFSNQPIVHPSNQSSYKPETPKQPSQNEFCNARTGDGQQACEKFPQCGWSSVMNQGKGKCFFLSRTCSDYENDKNWCDYTIGASGRPCQFVNNRCQ